MDTSDPMKIDIATARAGGVWVEQSVLNRMAKRGFVGDERRFCGGFPIVGQD
jgi:hypothetical protein